MIQTSFDTHTPAAQRVAQAIAAQVSTWWTSISTAAGRALVTAADAAAQRSALGLGTAATTAASAYATAAQAVPAGGTTGQVLAKTSATDYATAWTTPSGGGGTPGGSSGQFQYNNAGAFGGSAALTLDGSTLATTGNIRFSSAGGLNLFVYDANAIISGRYQTTERNRISLLQGSGHDIKINAAYGGSSGAVIELGVGGSTGYVEINNGTAGASNRRDLYARRVQATEGVQLTAATVGTLPSAASNTYLSAVVTDASAPTVGATVASGGSAKAVVRSNGTNYIVTEVL